MSNFGEMLKSLRKERKVSQRKLAELVGIDFTYISKIESGTMDPPAEDKILKIAEVLGVDPDTMILAAKKIPSDFQKVISENEEIPAFLRKAQNISPEQWKAIHRIVDGNVKGE